MECAICFDDCSRGACKLACGHAYHTSCMRSWFMKSENCDCPMCRRRVYVVGRPGLVDRWADERIDARKEDVMWEVIDDIVGDLPGDMFDLIPAIVGDIQTTFHRVSEMLDYEDDLYTALDDPDTIAMFFTERWREWSVDLNQRVAYAPPPIPIVAFAARHARTPGD